jgi:hypothetical protein
MKRRTVVLVVVVAALSLPAAVAKAPQTRNYQDAIVLRVDKHEDQPRAGGDNPSDAPLPDPETFSYDIALRVNCGTYVGRYQSWYDYVPAVFSPNQRIHLLLTRSVIYVPVPNQREVEMPIISKHVERGPCQTISTSAQR